MLVLQSTEPVSTLNIRCHARMVSGLATVAISSKAFLPSFWPIAASSLRSLTVSCTRPCICLRRIWFSVTRCLFRKSAASILQFGSRI